MTSVSLDRPLLFDPVYKDKIWGGRNLASLLGKNLPENLTIGESWELSGFDVEDLQLRGDPSNATLRQVLSRYGAELVGNGNESASFPLLHKFIDANDKLSVQVHPDDAQARENGWGDFGKTEAWYIVDAKPGAQIIVGLKEGVGLEDVRAGIESATLDTLLNLIHIAPGDMLFIPAGTVHAILSGTVIYEVQESSDTTFRLYDWGRVDAQGRARELHVEESLQVIDTMYHTQHKIPPISLPEDAGVSRAFRVACRYFALEEFFFARATHYALPAKNSFRVLSILKGSPRLVFPGGEEQLAAGQTTLLPASLREVAVTGDAGTHFLMTSAPHIAQEIVLPLREAGIRDEHIGLLGGHAEKNDILPVTSGS